MSRVSRGDLGQTMAQDSAGLAAKQHCFSGAMAMHLFNIPGIQQVQSHRPGNSADV
jgi:hypothetical protein